jgi:site-specific recombinase XerD
MLQPYRRHLKDCPHRAKGQGFSLCACPIWAYGIVNGKSFRRSLQTNDGTRAEQIMQVIERGLDPVLMQAQPESLSLKMAVDQFLAAGRARHLRDSTLESYEKTLDHLADHFPGADIAGIDSIALDRYRTGRTIAASTWRKELETLRAFFAWAKERGLVADNPARRLRMPRSEELTTLPLTAEEIERLLIACNQIASDDTAETPYIRKRARALLLTLLYSGLRISDIAALKRAALEKSGHLVLRVLKTGVRLKVLLRDSAIKALEALPAISPEYFFWTGRGDVRTCIKNMRRTIQRLGAIAKVHAHPHRFRDTFAVELLTRGADIRTVQKLLGHQSVRTTERHYAHFVAAHQALLDNAASRLDFEGRHGRPLLMKPRKNRRGNA